MLISLSTVSGMGGQERVLGGHRGFLIGDLDHKVIIDIMEDFLKLRDIPRKFCLVIFIKSMLGRGKTREEL